MGRKIGLISEHASPLGRPGGVDSGGQNVYVAQVARHLVESGHEVEVFTRRDDPALPDRVEWEDGITVAHLAAGPARPIPKEELLPWMGEFTRNLLQACREPEGGFHLLHANFFMSGMAAAEVKRTLGIPFVITFHALGRVRRLHQGQADGFPEARFAIEQSLVEEADRIIAECPQDREDLLRHYGADPERIVIVPCGFDPRELQPVMKAAARRRLGLDPQEPILLQLGRMVPRKGVDNAIRALAILEGSHGLSPRLLVVGGESEDPDPALTPEIGRLQAIADEEGVAGRVTFVGRRDRRLLKHYYSAADVFITTPIYEPFGITPLEAMACGTPVVGSRVGGIQHTVEDGATGFLVPPRDPAALAHRLAILLEHPSLLERFGVQAIERVHSRFTWRKAAAALAAVYEEVVADTCATEPSFSTRTALS